MWTFESVATLFGIVATVVSGVVWLVRLEGRVNTVEAVAKLNVETNAAQFDDFGKWLIRVEAKLDASLRHNGTPSR